MNVLVLDPNDVYEKRLHGLSCAVESATLLTGDRIGNSPTDSLNVDIIVGGGDTEDRPKLTEMLLNWRSHPHTYLVPCWIAAEPKAFLQTCLWPRLTIDRFDPNIDAKSFCDWVASVNEWQATRMQLARSNTLEAYGALELCTSLALRKAGGKLTILDEEGNEGFLSFSEGCLTDAAVKHIRGVDAFFEFLSWSEGSYVWEPQDVGRPGTECPQLEDLIAEGLRLIGNANLIYHFTPDLDRIITRTESEAALDDGAAAYFQEQKEIYAVIDGNASIAQIIEASPLSRPRTMSVLAKWFSLDDITLLSDAEQPSPTKLLIVDDSPLMCRVLGTMFSSDRRFRIVGVAHDGIEALELLEKQKPDVLTLDMQMPRMDGLTALKHIMIREPKPVVVVSAFTKETSKLTYDAFKYGAVDVLTKPAHGNLETMEKEARELRDRVASASLVKIEAAKYIRGRREDQGSPQGPSSGADEEAAASSDRLVAILCGSGGFPALLKLFFSLSAAETLPYVLAGVALPGKAVEAMAQNMESDSGIGISVLSDGETPLKSGIGYLYSTDICVHISGGPDQLKAGVSSECVEPHFPFDHLLESAAEKFGPRAAVFLISGVGEDGLEGMRRVQESGGRTYALSPGACLKPDLPGKVLDLGLAKEVMSPADMAVLAQHFSRCSLE